MKLNEFFEPCCPGLKIDDNFEEIELVEEPLVEALYQGHTVTLNRPQRGGTKKFFVYVKNKDGNVIKVSFGDPNATIKNDDPVRAASFQARHKCAEKTDKTTAGWWSCNISRYPSAGLSSTRPW